MPKLVALFSNQHTRQTNSMNSLSNPPLLMDNCWLVESTANLVGSGFGSNLPEQRLGMLIVSGLLLTRHEERCVNRDLNRLPAMRRHKL